MNCETLFVSGVGRSGTSALVNVLNSNKYMFIGQERFFNAIRRGYIVADHFKIDRFLDIQKDDTHQHGALPATGAGGVKRYLSAKYVGDKYPSLFRHFDYIFDQFPTARHVYIIRNPMSVVESYDARHKNPSDTWTHTWEDGLDAWNESVRRVSALSAEQLQYFTVVQYEDLFFSTAAINRLFAALGLEAVSEKLLDPFVQKFSDLNEKLVARRDDLRIQVARKADWSSYKKLLEIMEAKAA